MHYKKNVQVVIERVESPGITTHAQRVVYYMVIIYIIILYTTVVMEKKKQLKEK